MGREGATAPSRRWLANRSRRADVAGFAIPEDRKFLMVENQGQIGPEHKFSKEKLTTVMALYQFETSRTRWTRCARSTRRAAWAIPAGSTATTTTTSMRWRGLPPSVRMMVRQPQSKANAGSWTNGMPMTSALGAASGAATSPTKTSRMKHMMNYTWVAGPSPKTAPLRQELFGEFYGQEIA